MSLIYQNFNSFQHPASFLYLPSQEKQIHWNLAQKDMLVSSTCRDSELDSVHSGYSTESEFMPSQQKPSLSKPKRKALSYAAKKQFTSEEPFSSKQNHQSSPFVCSTNSMSNPQKSENEQSIQPFICTSSSTNKSTAFVEKSPVFVPTSAPSTAQIGIFSSSQQEPFSNNSSSQQEKYKTEMCKNWIEKGKCAYGQKCQFAHGKQELVDKKQLCKKYYKSKLCNTFHSTGVCPYGSRCMFIHENRTVQQIKYSSFYQRKVATFETSSQNKDNAQRLSFFEELTRVNE